MIWPLYKKIPQEKELSADLILDCFMDFLKENQIELYSAQEEAILELYSGKNVILNTPTGSGKSLVALALHFHSLALGRRSIYTCPIKALVNEKFLSLCKNFGPDQVGMITGDATVNPTAPIICCTAEILSNDALRLGSQAQIHDIIIDEFHYYSDRERGVSWQIPLLILSQSRFLLMSATLGDTSFFEKDLTRLNQKPTSVVQSSIRPVPLSFEYSETPLHELVPKLISSGRSPIYMVHFTQRQCADEAQNFLSIDFCSKEEKKMISSKLEKVQFSSPYGKEVQKLLKHGIGIHHAGLLPKYRLLVENLAQTGLLKIICGTDTLGVGVNIPIRTVLFTQLCKYDGEKTKILSIRDFQQISGRAGRKGFDQQGFVIAQAPEHLIENLRLEQKAVGDPKKLKKIVKKKPPSKGYMPWNKDTFLELIHGKPEPLQSQFKVSHSMLLNVFSRKDEDVCKSMQELIRNSHETPPLKKQHRKDAFQLFRSLIDKKIIELSPLRVNVGLQEDFSLNNTLSLYLIDTLDLLDVDHLDYAKDLLTQVESILENPLIILQKQLDRIKTEKMDELKMNGVEYDQRIEELEKLEYPKPNRDFIYFTFNEFSSKHPWIGQENIRPKSIAREMFENFHSFSDYIRDNNLQRSEGLLLRYLSDCYKVLIQTVPDIFKNDEVDSIITYLQTLIRQIDSSLLDQWEQLKNPNWISKDSLNQDLTQNTSQSLTFNPKKLKISVMNYIFQFIRELSVKNYANALSLIDHSIQEDNNLWTLEDLEKIMTTYYEHDHIKILVDSHARNSKNTKIIENSTDNEWIIQQTLVDSDQHNDWFIEFKLDLENLKLNQEICLQLLNIQEFKSY